MRSFNTFLIFLLGWIVSPSLQANDFALTLPIITVEGHRAARMDFNLAGEASVALEGAIQGEGETVKDKKDLARGESLKNEGGYEVVLLMSRFSEPMTMSGFYWSLGAGYRQTKMTWKHEQEVAADDYDTSAYAASSMVTSDIDATGMTGHGRLGYRYAAVSIPAIVGLYAGVRHFEAGFEARDVASNSDEEEYAYEEEDTATAELTEREKIALKRRIMTKPILGIELGFTF